MAAVEVHPLLLAEVNLAGKYNPPTYQDARIPVYAFLVLAGSKVMLVDTGVGEGNDYIDAQFAPDRKDLLAELKRHDLAPEDVSMLINSHLHFDHCGNNRLFPHTPVFVQAAELAAARTRAYTVREWFDHPAADLRPVSGNCLLAEGVRLIASPGHTPGHQSVLVETRQGRTLIAAQAAFSQDEYQRGGDPGVQAHEGLAVQYVDSLVSLKSLAAEPVLFSHDRPV